MKKIFYILLFLFILIQNSKQQDKKCKPLQGSMLSFIKDGQFQINDNIDDFKAIDKDKCENWFLDDLGYPCQMIWTKEEPKEDGDYDMKDLYILVPVNLDHYKAKNQLEVVKKLINLKLYPREEDIENEDGDENPDMEMYVDDDGEEVFLPIIKHDVLMDHCYSITEDAYPSELQDNNEQLIHKESLPYVKNIHTNYNKQKLPQSQSMRYFHHTYAMVSVKTLWERNQYTFDSIMKPLNGKALNDYFLLQNFRKSMVILNYLFSIIKNLAGISPFPEDTCKDIASNNKKYLPQRKKQLMFWIDELKDQMYNHTNSNNTKTESFINQRIDKQFKLEQYAEKKGFDENDSENQAAKNNNKKVKRKLANNKISCEQYFKKNPVFIPDISVQDFVLTVKPYLKASAPDADEKNTKSFKDLPLEELLDFITLSSYTYPEFINESEKFETIYDQDEMLKILKLHDADLSPSKHRYFYVIAQFYKLFQEFFDRYVINKVIFYNCFAIQDYSKPDLYCPQFLKDMLNILEKQERVSMHKLVSLDLHYIYENPKTLVLTIDKFLLKALEYSEAFADEKLKIKDQKGNMIENTQIDYESLNNDFASQAYHQKIVEKIVPEIQEISKISLRKTEYYDKLVTILRRYDFNDCSQEIDPEFMDQPLNQDFAQIMIKFGEIFEERISNESVQPIKDICQVLQTRKKDEFEGAYKNLKILQEQWNKYRTENEKELKLDLDKEGLDEKGTCDTPMCIKTKKQEAISRLNEKQRKEKLKDDLDLADNDDPSTSGGDVGNESDNKLKKKILI